MNPSPQALICPECGSADAPRLIVRGVDGLDVEDSVTLQCRSCRHEWSDRNPPDHVRQAS